MHVAGHAPCRRQLHTEDGGQVMRWVLGCLVLLGAEPVLGICKVLMPSNAPFTSPVVPAGDQPVIVRVWPVEPWSGQSARETLIVGPTFLEVGGTFALVVPVPASPLVKLAPSDIYNDAAKAQTTLVKSKVVEVEDASMGCQKHDPAFYSTAGSYEVESTGGDGWGGGSGGGFGCGGGSSAPSGYGISGGTKWSDPDPYDSHAGLGADSGSGCGGADVPAIDTGTWGEGPRAAEDAQLIWAPAPDSGAPVEDAQTEEDPGEDVDEVAGEDAEETEDTADTEGTEQEDTEGTSGDPKADDPNACSGTTTKPGTPWVTDHKLLGGYEVAILEGDYDGQMAQWLVANGFVLGETDSKLLRDYAEAGWSFVALKLTDVEDDAGTIQLNPIEITFDIENGPMLPVRIGWNALVGELHLDVWTIGDVAYVTSQHATVSYAAPVGLSSSSELWRYADVGDTLTRFDYVTTTEPPLWETLKATSTYKQPVVETVKTYKVPLKVCPSTSSSSGGSSSSSSSSGSSSSTSSSKRTGSGSSGGTCLGCTEAPSRSGGALLLVALLAVIWPRRRTA